MISCSGGSSSSLTAGGGIGGSGIISRGSISAFGSIVVNGTEFDTSTAAIIVGGELKGSGDDIARANLDIGRVVTVKGEISADGAEVTANRVTYNNNVEGPVENIRDIDPASKEILALGQTVLINAVTKFKETAFDTIAQSDIIAVSGYFDDTGAIWATFVEKTGEFTPGLEVEVAGFVASLDIGQQTFKINELTVNYSSADTGDLPGGVPATGLFVEVEGNLDAAGGEMLATDIELADELGFEDSDQVEVIGFVTDFVSVFEFTIGNQTVQTDADTIFIDGTPDDVAPGVKLEAEGSLADGILMAEEVEFWEPDQIEIEGFVTDVVSTSEFTVGSQRVRTDAGTVFEGVSPENIALGMKLEIKGVPVDLDHSILIADKVSLEED
jgi:hypothetical protein